LVSEPRVALESVSLRSMGRRRIYTGFRRAVPLGTFSVTLLAAIMPAQTPAPATAVGTSALTRTCSTNPVLPPPTSKKGKHKNTSVAPEPPPTCLEVKGEGIEVQEFLQNSAREESWRIGENRASEDTWSFVRYFDVDELEKYCNTKVLIEPVKFTSGKVAVTVRTTDLTDGYDRVQISTHFTGEGVSTDKTWAQPGSVWNLISKGVLEKELMAALQVRYKPVQ
jgi:hypothetical protein